MKKHLKDYFVPHTENDYSPHFLQKAAMMTMLLLAVFSFTVANLQTLVWLSSDWMVSTVLPSVIVDLTNDERSGLAVAPLQRNALLDSAAKLKAEHMAQNEYFSHYSPTGVSPWYWFNLVSYPYVHAGENLAIHFSDSGEVVDAWMRSPSHRENIANGQYREIGVGTAKGMYQGFETVYVVQLFGTQSVTPAPVETITVAQSTPAEDDSPVLAEQIDVLPVSEESTVVAESVSEPTPEESFIIEEPEPVALLPEQPQTESDSEPKPLFSDSDRVEIVQESTSTEIQEVEVAEVVVNDTSVSVFSETVSTTTGGIPASIDTSNDSPKQSSFFAKMATQPNSVLQVIYLMMGIFVVIALFMSVLIEVKQHRPMQVAYGLCLLMLMSGLFYVHSYVTSGALIA